MLDNSKFTIDKPIYNWKREGIVLERGNTGTFDRTVAGDPCIVWDDNRNCWHMFYFAQDKIGEQELNSNAHAVAMPEKGLTSGAWDKLGLLNYANPQDLLGDTHKPWLLMDPYRPGKAIKIKGEYWLFTVTYRGSNKVIQLVTSQSLDGPWKVRREPVLDIGDENDFDGYNVDALSAYWFEEKESILIIYMAYPLKPQKDQLQSPYGSCAAAAVMKPGDKKAVKVGRLITPGEGHWACGWVAWMQLFSAARGGWYALVAGSPTSPVSVVEEPSVREPAPGLVGWAYTPEEWPVSGWNLEDKPLEWLSDIPDFAVNWGEGGNMWRHFMLPVNNEEIILFYNSGEYSNERMFAKRVLYPW